MRGNARAIVLGGVGGFFSAGGDLPSMVGLDEAQARGRMRHVHRLCRVVAEIGLPVVSAIEGAAAGGGGSQHLYINMGPAHPAMHGIVRIFAELDGETVVKTDVEIVP